MAVYRCRFCGSIYDEEKGGSAGIRFKGLSRVHGHGRQAGEGRGRNGGGKTPDREKEEPPLKSRKHGKHAKTAAAVLEEAESYDPEYARTQTDARYMDEIQRDGREGTVHHCCHGNPDAYAGLGRHPVSGGSAESHAVGRTRPGKEQKPL
ncbi:MAG: hypothetical protein ACLR0U_05125 [Enterocloster clostridioformis]